MFLILSYFELEIFFLNCDYLVPILPLYIGYVKEGDNLNMRAVFDPTEDPGC